MLVIRLIAVCAAVLSTSVCAGAEPTTAECNARVLTAMSKHIDECGGLLTELTGFIQCKVNCTGAVSLINALFSEVGTSCRRSLFAFVCLRLS